MTDRRIKLGWGGYFCPMCGSPLRKVAWMCAEACTNEKCDYANRYPGVRIPKPRDRRRGDRAAPEFYVN